MGTLITGLIGFKEQLEVAKESQWHFRSHGRP